ncbi:MAG: polysaccharide biosynthesis/export family protein [Cytophagaceae bacterium]
MSRLTALSDYLKILIPLFVIFVSSCVPNKKIVVLQNNDLKGPANRDQVTTYKIEPYQYSLKPNDIISVRIASLSNDQYDFFRDYEMELGPILKPFNSRNQGMNVGGMGGQGQVQGAANMGRQPIGFYVDEFGYVELPLIKKIKVAGLTLKQAEDSIRYRANGFLEDPLVRVNLLSFQFSVFGEIAVEGIYTSYDPEINLLEALSISGNLTEFADRRNIKVIRMENDTAKVFYVNLLDQQTLTSPYFRVQPNDMIVVPPLKSREIRRYTISNFSTAISVVSASVVLIFGLFRLL